MLHRLGSPALAISAALLLPARASCSDPGSPGDVEFPEVDRHAAIAAGSDEPHFFFTADGSELWLPRTDQGTPSVWRSRRGAGGWQAPEFIVSRFAGEPTADAEGNLYFVHHYFVGGVMREADIYVAMRR